MTMRQWYKGMAMSGYDVQNWKSETQLAEYCGKIADAQIAEDAEAENG